VIRTTYFSALANGDVEPATDSNVLAVVRRDPPEWVEDLVDRHVPHLGPPEELLDAYKSVEEAAESHGEDDPRRIAWESVNFAERYREYLQTSSTKDVLEHVERTASQRAVWLVCWEAEETYCHRRLLREHIDGRVRDTFSTDVSLPPKENDYPGHRIEEVACDASTHDLVRVAPNVDACRECGLGLTTLVDILGHDPRGVCGGASA
jgi:uncharacterized protein YeaO (DUF488 family)